MGKSLMPDPERAPIVRRVFEKYATGRFTKQEVLHQARAWGLTNRRSRPLTSQAIGTLLNNRLYAGIVDVPEYGVRARRGDFEPLISEDLFPCAVGSVWSRAAQGTAAACAPGLSAPRVRPLRTLRSRAHRQLVEGPQRTYRSFEMPLRERPTGARLQVLLEAEGALLVRKLNDNVTLPRSARGGRWTAAGVVVLDSRVHIRCETYVEVWVSICIFRT